MEQRLEKLSLPVLVLAGVAILIYLLELFRLIPGAMRVPMLWINFLIDLLFLLDIIAKLAILRAKYIKSLWFLIDLVSTLPIISSATELMGSVGPQLQSARAARGARVARVARVARTARLAKVARVARVATAAQASRGKFLKAESDDNETPLFDRSLLVTIPILLVVFMIIAYVVTQQEVGQFTTHLSQQLEMAKTDREISRIPQYLTPQQARESRGEHIFLTKKIDSRLSEYAFSVAEAHVRADRIQGLMLVFVLMTVAGVVYMTSSMASDQDEGEQESMLRHFLSPAIVDKFDTNPEVVERFYSQRLSVFFIAIKGFKEAAEIRGDDIEAVALRRRHVMDIVRNQTVESHHGIVDKFMGDTVMGWIGGPFSIQWDRLTTFRERLALDALEFAEQDIKSIARQLSLIDQEQDADLTSPPPESGLPSDHEAHKGFLQEALSEGQAARAALLDKHQAAKDEDPSLEARYEEALLVYQQEAATAAVTCCLNIWEEVAQQQREDAFHDLSIGIASGPVSVGNYGSTDQIGFTVLGATVDLAAQLEPISAKYGCRLLIDLTTYKLVKSSTELQFRMLPPITVSGVEEPVVAYEPFTSGAVPQSFLDAFHEGVFAIQRHDFESAIKHFEHADQTRDGGDLPSLWWRDACRAALRDSQAVEGSTTEA